MKKIIYIPLCMILFCCACSDADTEFNPATQALHITMRFQCGEMTPTRTAADDTRIDDINLYLFPVNGKPARHLYIAPLQSVVLVLPIGDYALYAIANLGRNSGKRTLDFVRALRVERDPLALADTPFPMSSEQTIAVRGDAQITVALVRAVAKVNFSYTVAAYFAATFRVQSVQLRSAPLNIALFGSSHAENVEAVAGMPPVKTSATSYTATYYLLENRQGQVTGISSQQQKDQSHAPEYATYIAIAGEADGTQVMYRIYLGENDTTDFNVVRNRVYTIDARILGMNTVDWRVSTAELSVAPFAASYVPGQPATSELRLTSTNDHYNAYYLSYEIDEGTGALAIDGEKRYPGTPNPIHLGNGTVTADISYTQSEPGDARQRLTVTDFYGLKVNRQLSTAFKPALTVVFTQWGNDLTYMDRAYLSYTISQPGYSGSYNVTIEGIPSVFRGRESANEIPQTKFTENGNGNYSLRIKPERLGENPMSVTITDQNGNSACFTSSANGIQAKAKLKPRIGQSGSFFNVEIESSLPVIEDLQIILLIRGNWIGRGGSVTPMQYSLATTIKKRINQRPFDPACEYFDKRG